MNKKAFTLLELLVVVLIIGILAAVALPQYKMAVTKAKVASILPLMRRWYDALAEYQLQHGDYGSENDGYPDGATLGVNWPSDWKTYNQKPCGDSTRCWGDYWDCYTNTTFHSGEVFCAHDPDQGETFLIVMHQPDYEIEEIRGITCQAAGNETQKICKHLGGIETGIFNLELAYKLNF